MTRLLSLFCGLCAVIALPFAAFDAIVIHRQQQWPATDAMVKSADIRIDHPFPNDGGGTTYQLDTRLVAGDRLLTVRSSSARDAGVMNEWIERHPRGSHVGVRIDPARSGSAVFADPEDLPLEHHPKEDLILFAGFGGAAVLLWWLPIPRRAAQSPDRTPPSAR